MYRPLFASLPIAHFTELMRNVGFAVSLIPAAAVPIAASSASAAAAGPHARTLKVCAHGCVRNCSQCGDLEVCSHGRELGRCWHCGHGPICAHGYLMLLCKKCGGKHAPCDHGVMRRKCKTCRDVNEFADDDLAFSMQRNKVACLNRQAPASATGPPVAQALMARPVSVARAAAIQPSAPFQPVAPEPAPASTSATGPPVAQASRARPVPVARGAPFQMSAQHQLAAAQRTALINAASKKRKAPATTETAAS